MNKLPNRNLDAIPAIAPKMLSLRAKRSNPPEVMREIASSPPQVGDPRNARCFHCPWCALGAWTIVFIITLALVAPAAPATAATSYTITVRPPAGGTISPGTISVSPGASQSFTITPSGGSSVQDIWVNDGSGSSSGTYSVLSSSTQSNGVYTYTFTNVQNKWYIGASFTPYSLQLIGATTVTLAQSQFASLAAQYPSSFTDNNGAVWTGVPLWRLVGLVDDADPNSFNDSLASAYSISVITCDPPNNNTTFSASIPVYFAHNDYIIVANKRNGLPIPSLSSGTSGWQWSPLRLLGSNDSPPNSTDTTNYFSHYGGGLVRLQLTNLPTPTPTPSPGPSPSPTPNVTPTPTPTPSPSPSPSPTITSTPTPAPSPSPSPTLPPSPTPSPSPAPTPASSGLQSIPGFSQVIGSDGIVYLNININRVRNPQTDADVQANGGIGGFDFTLTYPGGATGNAVNIMAVKGAGPFSSPAANIHNDTGSTRINTSQTGSAPQAPLTLAQVAPRIIGSSTQALNLSLSFASLVDAAAGANIPADSTKTYAVRRGDARADGSITIADALFIAQTAAGLRDIGEGTGLTNAVNGASVKLESTATGERLTIADALLLAQYLAGLTDDSFNSVN